MNTLWKITILLLMMTLCLQSDNYYKEYYDIGYNHNHPHETCHSYGGITQNYLSNIQLVYLVRVLYDDPAPIVINKKNFAYVKSINSFMHVAHDKNILCDSYIVKIGRASCRERV